MITVMRTPRLLWIQEQVGSLKKKWVKRREQPDEDTMRALDNLKTATRKRDVVGIAVVALTHDGNYQLVISGDAFDNPHCVVAGASRLSTAVGCLMPRICGDDDQEFD